MAGANPRFVYACDQWEIDLERRELRSGGVPVPLGSRAFEIVEVLVQSANELVTKDDLMNRVWPGAIVAEATLHVHISAVRKALGQDRHLLKTTQGRGYRLLGSWILQQQSAAYAPLAPEPSPLSSAPQTTLPVSVTRLVAGSNAVQRMLRASSGFPCSDLDENLKQRSTEKIILIGLLANTSVKATGLIAMGPGYRVTVCATQPARVRTKRGTPRTMSTDQPARTRSLPPQSLSPR
jgi:DNA-binding winged helix-turn-helix (wHTH) protein